MNTNNRETQTQLPHPVVIKPLDGSVLYGIGTRQAIGTVQGVIGLDCWHPDLPEVRVNHRGPAFCEVYTLRPADQRQEEPNWPWHRVNRLGKQIVTPAVLFLSLVFGGIAHAIEPAGSTAQPQSASATCHVNVQTCTPVECAFLPGVGEKTAQLITSAHPKTEEELDAIKGVGEKKLAGIRPFAVYGTEKTTCAEKQHAAKKAAAPVAPKS